jgi:FkbH-like protein
VNTTTDQQATARTGDARRGRVKCVVWDLDNTLWDGVLLEDGQVRVRADVVAVIQKLDERGILQSIASKNDHVTAMLRLEQAGLADYFLYPQINWNAKSSSVRAVARLLNIGIDTLAFVDDQPFELEEVAFAAPEVLCVLAQDIGQLTSRPEFTPRFVTDDARLRRGMYLAGVRRDEAERDFVGTSEDFLSTLDMVLTICLAQPGDLERAEELTVRTNQLNSTAVTYSIEELRAFADSPDHLLLVADLVDKHGSYGKIGLALVECGAEVWTLKLLLMSCRVMSRGVGTVLLNHVMRLARDRDVRLCADFVPTSRNRVMYVTYRFAGFTETGERAGVSVLESDLSRVQDVPGYLRVRLL